MLAYYEDEAVVPGAVGFIQTSGALLNFHPYMHLLITDGVFDRDGRLERFTFFDTQLIARLYRAELLRMLRGKGLISQEVVDNLLSWRHSGFSVHGDVKVPDGEGAACLGRYMTRCPLPGSRFPAPASSPQHEAGPGTDTALEGQGPSRDDRHA